MCRVSKDVLFLDSLIKDQGADVWSNICTLGPGSPAPFLYAQQGLSNSLQQEERFLSKSWRWESAQGAKHQVNSI